VVTKCYEQFNDATLNFEMPNKYNYTETEDMNNLAEF